MTQRNGGHDDDNGAGTYGHDVSGQDGRSGEDPSHFDVHAEHGERSRWGALGDHAERGVREQPESVWPAAPGEPPGAAGGLPQARDPLLAGPQAKVAVRGPVELADALPYLMGFHPDDSVVVVALHGERGRFGGRIRIGIPAVPGEWPAVAAQIAACLEGSTEAHTGRPDGALVYLCQDPAAGEIGRTVMERLRPLAQRLRTACGEREMPVYEALCLSAGRVWSYCCSEPQCCPHEGRPLTEPGTSPMAAACAYAGIRLPGSLREMEARLAVLGPPTAEAQERALDSVGAALVPRLLTREDRRVVRTETIDLAGKLMERFRARAPGSGGWAAADAHDDGLLDPAEAAAVILGIQDRKTRDHAAEWMEGLDVGPALRLWRALARRCVGPYAAHAAPPLTLAGWVAWSGGDEPAARVALGRALRTDPGYIFAQLLHRACNDGLDPEPLRCCMRAERAARDAARKHEPSPADRRNSP